MRSRVPYVLLALLTIALGLGARAALTGAPAKHLGVMLYAVMMAWVVKCIAPRLPVWRAGAIALAVCWAVEAMQATPIPAAINARLPLMRLALGEHFEWSDLLTYALGVLAACAALAWTSRTQSPRPPTDAA
ncbi:MAG: DUF2809 domain-containing protein [Phycisphaerales bacterium]|nr:DUF2809 domain-containing protein [Phycisphaerales bacterium]